MCGVTSEDTTVTITYTRREAEELKEMLRHAWQLQRKLYYALNPPPTPRDGLSTMYGAARVWPDQDCG